MTKEEAKKIIREELKDMRNRLTARTVSFADLARDSCIFVCVHDWEPSPLAEKIRQTAKAHGFCAEFKGVKHESTN